MTTADQAFIAARTTALELPDGTRLVIRPLVPGDRELILEGFERLSPQSRYRRFFGVVRRLPESTLAWLDALDYHDHFAWGALACEDGRDVPVGISRYTRLPGRPQVAEAAIAVIDPYHGRGIGSLLFDALVLEALEAGIGTFEGQVLADNRPMLELLRGLGGRFRYEDPGTVRFEVDLARAGEGLKTAPAYHVLRAVARGEAQL